jgi:hypothetical protein
MQYDEIEVDSGFCPEHKDIAMFTSKQCIGCVGSWGDCDLFKDFAYSNRNLVEGDFDILRKGICPRRTNGTLMFNSGTGLLKRIDLSETSDTKVGMALEKPSKSIGLGGQ